MAGVLGRAFVQVFADLSKFSPGLREDIKKHLDEQTKGMKFEELDKASEKAGEDAAENIGKGLDRKIENETDKEGRKGGVSLGKGLSAGFAGASAALMPTLIALGVEAAAALAGPLTAVAATLPALIGTMVAGLATIKLATNGVGDALKNAFDPSKAKQFQQAMQKLAPSAREFVLEIQRLHQPFKQLQQDVQQTFFVQLQGTLTRVANQVLPALRSGLHTLAADLGAMGRNLLTAFGNGKEDLASIFIAAHEAIKPFIPLIGQMVSAFLAVGAVAGPLFAQLSGGFAKVLGQFLQFVNAAADSGKLAAFFDAALPVLKNVGSLLGNIVGLVGDILSALAGSGGEALGVVGRLAGMLNKFFASAEGRQTLVSVFDLLNTALDSLFKIITPLLPLVAQLVTSFSGDFAKALTTITPDLVAIADWLAKNPDLIKGAIAAWGAYKAALIAVSVAEGIMDALDPLTWIVLAAAAIAAGAYLIIKNWDAVTRFFKGVGDAIGDFFKGIWNWIVGIGRDIGNWFTVTLPSFFASLPGKIGSALAALPGMLWNLFLNALHMAGEAIGIGIGLIIAAVIKLPGLIWTGIKDIGHFFSDVFHTAINTGRAVLDAGINAVVYTFTVLPGRIATWVQRLPGIIGGAFRSAWNSAKTFVREGADDVVSFVQKLPGRISGFMRNVGHDILSGLKSGINAVISGFNSGIDKVAGFVHIGLPHIPMLATGGLVNSPTLAVVGEAGPEAVVPMSDPSRAQQVARQTGLLDMLGSAGGHAEATNVRVYLGTREITDILDVRIDKKMNDQANELAFGTR